VHLFSIVEHGTGPLGQVVAPSKEFEIAAFATVLDRLDLTDVVVTADACTPSGPTPGTCTGTSAGTQC